MSSKRRFSHLIMEAGLTVNSAADILSVSERTIRRWVSGDNEPKKIVIDFVERLIAKKCDSDKIKKQVLFRFIDLFAGIGGIRLPFDKAGGECVFSSEWDKFSQITYAANYGEIPNGDITQIKSESIPSHDLLLAGFPCQSFSQAGLKKGFMDTRGTMFFEIQRILAHHRPKAFLLENVKQLKGHNKGETLQTINSILRGENEINIPDGIPMTNESKAALAEKLNYWVDFKVLRATDFGLPQKRERIFIVGFDKDFFKSEEIEAKFSWPLSLTRETCLGDILLDNGDVPEKYTISDRTWKGHKQRRIRHKEKGNGFGYSLFSHKSPYANTIRARYYKDGSEVLIDQSDIGKNPRKLTPRECARLQGFPENFIIGCVSDVQAYKQFGNSVPVKVVSAVANSMMPLLSIIEDPQ